jgi:hypothetical protein
MKNERTNKCTLFFHVLVKDFGFGTNKMKAPPRLNVITIRFSVTARPSSALMRAAIAIARSRKAKEKRSH